MKRILALVLVVAATLLARQAGGEGLRTAALGLGFALIAAALAGDLFEHLWLPRVSGYLIFGLVCGPSVANIISRSMARELQLFNGLAIALIAFMAGLELNIRHLRPRLPALLRFGWRTMALLYGGLFAAFWLSWPWLPIDPAATGLARLALVVLLTTVVASFSPTVTIAVITDTRSRGPLSEATIALVVLADLALILFFTFSMQAVRWALGGAAEQTVGMLPRVTWEVIGSLAFGAAAGSLFALYMRYVGRELTLVLLALCVVLSGVGARFDFEPLLAALAAGLVVENIAAPGSVALKEAVEQGARPVLIVFFAATGASLHLDALALVGVVALAVWVLRLVLIYAGTTFAARRSTIDPAVGRSVWMGLVSQAGVTVGLVIIVATEYPTWGRGVEVLIVALISLNELVGPILFRSALARHGEIARMDAPAPLEAVADPAGT
ncbi:MAG: cation:proton antiporter [Acidobacteriota bacterium]|nr:cation:proton antiporter [Acidobacteriota bacterium]